MNLRFAHLRHNYRVVTTRMGCRAERSRRGLNLVEVVVAIAIALGLLTLGGMFFQNLTGAKEFSAVKLCRSGQVGTTAGNY